MSSQCSSVSARCAVPVQTKDQGPRTGPRALIKSDARVRRPGRDNPAMRPPLVINYPQNDSMASTMVRSTILRALPAGSTLRHAGLVSNQGNDKLAWPMKTMAHVSHIDGLECKIKNIVVEFFDQVT